MASSRLILLAVFFLALNLWAGLLMSTGVAGTLNLQSPVGGGDQVNKTLAETGEVSSGAPTGSTLFGMYNVLVDIISGIASVVTAGPTMLNQAGVPSVITSQLLKPLIGLVYALGLVSALLRYRL